MKEGRGELASGVGRAAVSRTSCSVSEAGGQPLRVSTRRQKDVYEGALE